MLENLGWINLLPEIVLLVMACVITLLDLRVTSRQRTFTYVLSLLTLGGVAMLLCMGANAGATTYSLGNMVVNDSMGGWLKCFATLAVMASLVYGRAYAADRDMLRGGEMFSLSLFALLGMFIMISGNNFLLTYLGLELLTLSSYALVALRRDHADSTESAMKYFVLGAIASGFLLYGLSMLYGATGSLDINVVLRAVKAVQQTEPQAVPQAVLVLGLVFVVAGLAFKLGVVPFHMWVPDVYQGAPTSVTNLIGSAPKLAAFAIVIRLLVEGMMPLAVHWQQMFLLLAVGSLAVGNLAAIAQTNLKRMLAFSTISQMGFVLLGLLSGVMPTGLNENMSQVANASNAYSSAMFYVITYALTSLAGFGVILLLAREGFESEEIADFAGLNQRSPLYAAIMAITLFSLAGIPPMVGFYAKLSVLQALLASGQSFAIPLAVFAVLMSLVGAFYYLRVVKVMYFDAPITASTVAAPLDVRVVLSVNGALLLLLGIMPGGLMGLCVAAISKVLSS